LAYQKVMKRHSSSSHRWQQSIGTDPAAKRMREPVTASRVLSRVAQGET
jgi:hypothetical protein